MRPSKGLKDQRIGAGAYAPGGLNTDEALEGIERCALCRAWVSRRTGLNTDEALEGIESYLVRHSGPEHALRAEYR
jgi:hypothetical protein